MFLDTVIIFLAASVGFVGFLYYLEGMSWRKLIKAGYHKDAYCLIVAPSALIILSLFAAICINLTT